MAGRGATWGLSPLAFPFCQGRGGGASSRAWGCLWSLLSWGRIAPWWLLAVSLGCPAFREAWLGRAACSDHLAQVVSQRGCSPHPRWARDEGHQCAEQSKHGLVHSSHPAALLTSAQPTLTNTAQAGPRKPPPPSPSRWNPPPSPACSRKNSVYSEGPGRFAAGPPQPVPLTLSWQAAAGSKLSPIPPRR